MGVDYDGVGGVGFPVKDYLEKFLKDETFKKLWEYNGDYAEAVDYVCRDISDENHVMWVEAGSAGYGGEARFYIIVDGNTLDEVNTRAVGFCEFFNERYDLELKPSELQIITDLSIW